MPHTWHLGVGSNKSPFRAKGRCVCCEYFGDQMILWNLESRFRMENTRQISHWLDLPARGIQSYSQLMIESVQSPPKHMVFRFHYPPVNKHSWLENPPSSYSDPYIFIPGGFSSQLCYIDYRSVPFWGSVSQDPNGHLRVDPNSSSPITFNSLPNHFVDGHLMPQWRMRKKRWKQPKTLWLYKGCLSWAFQKGS